MPVLISSCVGYDVITREVVFYMQVFVLKMKGFISNDVSYEEVVVFLLATQEMTLCT